MDLDAEQFDTANRFDLCKQAPQVRQAPQAAGMHVKALLQLDDSLEFKPLQIRHVAQNQASLTILITQPESLCSLTSFMP